MLLRGTIASDILAMDTNITILTPTHSTTTSPQCVYLLHGLHGNNASWSDYSMLIHHARKYNLTFIMPEVGRSFYTDMEYGPKYFSYIAHELPDIIKRTFNIAGGRENTAVMGGSMGGNGALKVALRRPDRFGKCAVFASAAIFLKRFIENIRRDGAVEWAEHFIDPQLVADFRSVLGNDFVVKPEDDLPALAQSMADGYFRPVFYASCGIEDEPFIGENREFADLMRELGYSYTYEELPGDHHWPYFDAALKRGLEFFYGSGE